MSLLRVLFSRDDFAKFYRFLFNTAVVVFCAVSFLISFLLLNTESAFAATPSNKKQCEGYFIQIDVLNQLTETEKQDLKQWALKYSSLENLAHEETRDLKTHLDLQLNHFLQTKHFSKKQYQYFLVFFSQYVGKLIKSRSDHNMQILQDELTDKQRREEQRQYTQQKHQRMQSLLKKLDARDENELLEKILKLYGSKNINEALIDISEKPVESDNTFQQEIRQARVEFLLEMGIDKNYQDPQNRTAVWFAIKNLNFPLLELLLKNEVNKPTEDNKDNLFVRRIIQTPISERQYDKAIILLLMEYGYVTDLNILDKRGYTVFHQAIIDNQISLLQLLIDAGADVNLASKDGTTPLRWAILYNSKESVEILLRANADVYAVGRDKLTPLTLAYALRSPNKRPVIFEMIKKYMAENSPPSHFQRLWNFLLQKVRR